MPTYRAMQRRKKSGGGLMLMLVVLGAVVTMLGLTYRRTHTAANGPGHSVPARETSAPANTTPAPEQKSSSDRNG